VKPTPIRAIAVNADPVEDDVRRAVLEFHPGFVPTKEIS